MKKIILILLAVLNLGVPVFALVQIAKFSFRIFTPFELIMLIVLIIISIHANSIIFRKYIFKRRTKSIAIPENSDEGATPLDEIKSRRRLILAIFSLYTLIAVALPAFYFSNTIYVFINADNEDIEKIVEQVVHFKPSIEYIYDLYQTEYIQVPPEKRNPDRFALKNLIYDRQNNTYWERGDSLHAIQRENDIWFIRYPWYSIIALYNLDTKSWRFKTYSVEEDNYYYELGRANK